jgi:hypothetical protein
MPNWPRPECWVTVQGRLSGYPVGMRIPARISSVIAVLLLFVPSLRASADNVSVWTFVASLGTGSMAGTTFPVCYSYDADQVPPVGEGYVQLNSFDFTLGAARFTRSDIFQGGQVIFRDGASQNVTASFQVFMPPNSPVANITFGFGGDGVIGYIDLSGQYGDGLFALASQTYGCSELQPAPLPSPSIYPSPSPVVSPSPVISQSRSLMVSPSPFPCGKTPPRIGRHRSQQPASSAGGDVSRLAA